MTGPDRGGFPAWIFTAVAVLRAGGNPVRLTPGRVPEPDRVHVDGLILGGGADVDPSTYREFLRANDELLFQPDEAPTEHGRSASFMLAPLVWFLRRFLALRATGIDPDRDSLETNLMRRALESGIPVLGICRGMQLINVVSGGTLHPDVRQFYGESEHVNTVLPRKKIYMVQDSVFSGIFGENETRVNSLHDQAIHRLGRGVRVVARDRGGVIQAIERIGEGTVFGVQWHPEYLPMIDRQQTLFRALVNNARLHRADRPQARRALSGAGLI